MDDKTAKTGSGGAPRRFSSKRTMMVAGIVTAVLLVAAGAGFALRMWQNDRKAADMPVAATPSLPQKVIDVQDLRLEGNAAEADRKIDAALQDSKTSGEERYLLYIQRGAGLYDGQKYAEAIAAYNSAAGVKQTSEVYGLLGDAYAAAGQKNKAVEAYRKAIPLLEDTPIKDEEQEAIEAKIAKLEAGS